MYFLVDDATLIALRRSRLRAAAVLHLSLLEVPDIFTHEEGRTALQNTEINADFTILVVTVNREHSHRPWAAPSGGLRVVP